MNSSKFLVSTLMYLFLNLSASFLLAQGPNLNLVSNQNGVVTYSSTGTNPNTGVFILYGNGHFGRALNPSHKFEPNNVGYNTKAFYLTPYDDIPPLQRSVSTNQVGSGTSTNLPYFLPAETKIETSWNPTVTHDTYIVLIFENKTRNNTLSGCLNFYYKDEEILINTNEIIERSDWVNNRQPFSGNYGIYNRRFRWNFSNLQPAEQRVVYIPIKSKLPAGNNINTSSSLSTDCNFIPSSLPNQSSKVSAYPHDPNLKSVTGCIDRTDNRSQKLEFKIDFQNIGEGPANNVIIEDQLSSELDASTLIMLPAQYPYTYTVSPTNKLTITFTGINLPGIQQQGVNTEDTKSSVSFRVCSVSDPECVYNTATITFDNQPALTTNTVEACDLKANCTPEICAPAGYRINIDNNFKDIVALEAFPNPVDDVLNIRFSSETSQIHLINIAGQVIQNYDIDMHIREKSIDMSNLNSGIYFLRVIGQNQNKTLKVIKN